MSDDTSSEQGLAEHTSGLSTSDPETDPSDLRPLRDALANARVVGLGEATHGTREFCELRHRVVRLLVENLDYRLFGLEAGFTETLAIDNYVVRGEGDPREALAGLDLWPWNTEEMLALVEWLREFNADRPLDDRVRFYGFDAQFVEKPVVAVREYLSAVDPDGLAEIADDICSLESKDVRGERYAVAKEHVDAAEATVAALTDRFERREDEYVDTTSRNAYDLARRQLRTIEQATEFARASHEHDEPRGAVSLRDEYMVENVAWILNHEDRDRIVLWAHNGHLMKTGTDGGPWEEFTPMGSHLAERFGEDYHVIGTDFNRGSFLATPDPVDVEDPEPRPFTVGRFHEEEPYDGEPWAPDRPLNGALTGLDPDPLYLDVAAAADDPGLGDWLACRHPVRDIGNAFWDESFHLGGFRLPVELDGLLFVETSTPTRLLDGEASK
ncbi:MAG: erythromycin esterase family protein [Halalkalicoccus sp.]